MNVAEEKEADKDLFAEDRKPEAEDSNKENRDDDKVHMSLDFEALAVRPIPQEMLAALSYSQKKQ